MALSEKVLADHLTCPLLSPVDTLRDPAACAERLMQWALLEAFNGRLVPAPNLRSKFLWFWQQQDPSGVKDALFYQAVRNGNTAAKRIYMFLQLFEPLIPVTSYEMLIDGQTVLGQYAMVQRRGRSRSGYKKPLLLMVHSRRPKFHQCPDVVEMLRYLHVMRSTTATEVGIYHLPLLEGTAWERRQVDVALVAKWVSAILKTVEMPKYPVAGNHCDRCALKTCREVFRG
jgi:hypothetical protein